MAFRIEKVNRNDYRCGCCFRSWEDVVEWKDTLEEALAEFPAEFPKEHNDGGLHTIAVIDEATGERVAWGEVTWPWGYGRSSGYAYTRWSGFRPDQGVFKVIIKGKQGGPVVDKTWEEIVAELAAAYEAQRKARPDVYGSSRG